MIYVIDSLFSELGQKLQNSYHTERKEKLEIQITETYLVLN